MHSKRTFTPLLFPLLALLAVLTLLPASLADEAREITDSCRFTKSGKNIKHLENMLDRDYRTFLSVYRGNPLEIDAGGKTMGALYLQYSERPVPGTVEAFVGGVWEKVQDIGSYLTEYVPLPYGTTRVKLFDTSKSRMFIAELYVFAPGTQPDFCATWHTGEKADLMLIHCHPDDEVLWFGGLLPTYTALGYEVQVVTVVPATPVRRLELLDSLWHCGVTRYPYTLGLADTHASTLAGQYRRWDKAGLIVSMAKAIRIYRPEVIVSHDLEGEYGHAAHMATADCAREAFTAAADPGSYRQKLGKYAVWQAKKLYLHLYAKGRITMDWHTPLPAFGGKDGITVATEAFAFHKSKQKTWHIEDAGAYSNAEFGLVTSLVG
ncbi:MAG: PIG-L family deacetylase, partial [Clostridia bacterium]|nr:PIG-L family deacetylase [Clostridia bacterium]